MNTHKNFIERLTFFLLRPSYTTPNTPIKRKIRHSKSETWETNMKWNIRTFIACIVIGVFVIAWYLIYSPQSHADIAITVATVLGLALTATGTQIGIIAISKSHEATMMQYRLIEIKTNRKMAHEIYENILVPLQNVLNDINYLGESLFDDRKQNTDNNGGIVMPENLSPLLEEHGNTLKAKLNMIVLYVNKDSYQNLFNATIKLSKEIDLIIKHYNERTWTRSASESVIKSRELASKLYEDIIEHIKILR